MQDRYIACVTEKHTIQYRDRMSGTKKDGQSRQTVANWSITNCKETYLLPTLVDVEASIVFLILYRRLVFY